MSIIKDLERTKICVLDKLITVLNGMGIIEGEVGETMNEIYFVIGFYKEMEPTEKQGYDKLVIISDVLKLNLNDWDRPIVDFIYDVLVTLPFGYTVLGIFQWKYDYNEWFEIINEHRDEEINSLWDPKTFTNFIILPVFNLESVIYSLKIFALGEKNSYLIPDTVVSVVTNYSELGFFTNSEFQISLPFTYTDNDKSGGMLKVIKDIIEIIKTNLSISSGNGIVYYYNINHRIRKKDHDTFPLQVPVYFSRNIGTSDLPDDNNSENTAELSPHFFSSFKITRGSDDNSLELTLNLQACIFRLLSTKEHNGLINTEFKEQVRRCFINKCNYIGYRYTNRSPLFFCKNDFQFGFYLFKLPNYSIPISLLNTGLLYGDIEEKKYRKRWCDVFNIKPLMPFISKDLALIPKSIKQISDDNELYISDIYYKNKIISPHLGIIEKLKHEMKRQVSDKSNKEKFLCDINQEGLSGRMGGEQDVKYEFYYNQMRECYVYNNDGGTTGVYVLKVKCLNNQLDFIIGDFYFYHFNQDPSIKDIGWTCTYKTVQMVLSWYLINNYTNKHVLSIIEMQELIRETDTLNFELEVGSETVLGIVQASFLLSLYIGVYSCIKFYIGVLEFIHDYEVIVKHFRTIGSPVIANLGEYSYLIVGIQICKGCSCSVEDSVQYLIVDPHYFGNDDDVEYLYKKNAVSWRGSNFLFSASEGKPIHVLFPSNNADNEKNIIY
ncbi:hypothetical protein FG379_001856 [Cryptosporidium bovis]|uniref:uncharacterized protein n=1 Tax=Cryptosporidium bovis TaxID=310047 RepID=UPI00351A1164|nr:hypothetical protein FG379_001856 [Cryptosporidium bovis]